MGLRLLLETTEAFEELRLAFLMGHLFEVNMIQRQLVDRYNNMDHAQVWNDDFAEAFALSTEMKSAFRKYGNVKIAEAHAWQIE